MDLADIRGAWAWAGLEPAAIVDINEFGNVLVLDTVGRYWRVCPEELAAVSVTVVVALLAKRVRPAA